MPSLYTAEADTSLDTALKKYFGYDSFREGQREVVLSVLNGRDVLAVMPTGSGKSICYQLPAMMMSGITLVVSPLISLMRDQVAALGAAGIRAAYINSTLTPRQCSLALERAAGGAYKIIYVAPERLLTSQFLNFALNADISLVAVDEAHCVSQWGHDFRRSYLSIGDFVGRLPRRPVLAAMTATATDRVKADISELLGLDTPTLLTTGYDRPNLYFGVDSPKDKVGYIVDFVKRRPGKLGIIYCSTRKQVDLLCGELTDRGVSAVRYHAGLTEAERSAAQDDFIYDRCRIVVATNAFGMGIDKSNVAFVIHYSLPLCMESYYQEAGRAGRDGNDAECVLLYSYRDVKIAEFLIENSEIGENCDAEEAKRLKSINLGKLERMKSYCSLSSCLRADILRYFGEEYKGGACGKCSVCLRRNKALTLDSVQTVIGELIIKTGGRYGAGAILDILAGDRTEKLVARGYDRLFEFGALKLHRKSDIRNVINDMLRDGLLERTEGEYPLLRVTKKLTDAMEKKKSELGAFPLPRRVRADEKLLAKLKLWRKETAYKLGLPPYVIFTDITLEIIATELPTDITSLKRIRGISEKKAEKYGKQITETVRRHKDPTDSKK